MWKVLLFVLVMAYDVIIKPDKVSYAIGKVALNTLSLDQIKMHKRTY